MVILADWAAIAIATAQTVEQGRLRERVEAAERERHHWAHELHDEALQQLAAIRLHLAAALRSAPEQSESQPLREAARHTVDRLEGEIDNLSRLINELRPVPLETLGLRRALEALAEETADQTGIAVDAQIDLPEPLSPDAERTVYRLCQESLTNVAKHSEAGRAELAVAQVNGALTLKVSDYGVASTPPASHRGRPAGDAGARRGPRRDLRDRLARGRGHRGQRPGPDRELADARVGRLDQLVLDREAHELGTAPDPQLALQPACG